MANHPLTGAYLPADSTDAPAGGTQITQAVNQLSPYVVPRFATTADRDKAYASWVAAGNTLKKNMLCATDSPDTVWRYGTSPAGWRDMTTVTPSWQNISAASGWSTSGVDVVGQYTKDPSGRVWLRGQIKNTSTFTPNGQLMFTLPSGYRPPSGKEAVIPCFHGSTFILSVRVTDTGRVEAFRSPGNQSLGSGAKVSLDPINFSTI